mmetsp:Transcript_22298/g.42347  ORF Transcript_22298/g.42347 Transcript_22298/m.42347 type:complete len:224 (-) Transcript_22298:207-878(-)|eukprot:scaffold1803_cov92-Amphora_coffeaeformis.AAC.36
MRATSASSILLAAVAVAAVEGRSSWSFTQATFIPPAVDHHYQNNNPFCLSAKKKSAAPTAASKKIQVKLLKHVAGTGQAGEVVMVTPPFYNNKLRPTKSAALISDEQVEMEKSQAELHEKERQLKATALQEQVQSEPIVLRRKAGPDGQLFGGIGPKILMDELKVKTGENVFLDDKGVKITALLDGNGKKMRGDIKHVGSFQASLQLTQKVIATIKIEVEAEE